MTQRRSAAWPANGRSDSSEVAPSATHLPLLSCSTTTAAPPPSPSIATAIIGTRISRAHTVTMPVHFGVRVTLKRFEDDKPYREYRRTQQSSTGSRMKKEVYVAAVSGERFYVLVDLTGLHFRSAPDVKVSFRIDAGGKKNHYFSAKDKGAKLSLKYKDTERFIDGEWKSCAPTFRNTEIGVFLLSFYAGGGNMQTSCRRSCRANRTASRSGR